MTAPPLPRPFLVSPAAVGAFGLTASNLGALWYVSLMRPVWTAASLVSICGHGGLWAVHCPACYAALALSVGGVALAGVRRA